jgi:orotidine-5'-phosphate decarboxylase
MTIPIVALDLPNRDAALAMVDRLGDRCGFYKIGSELFTAEGPAMVRDVIARGKDVFLDLKYHDIPNTVANGVRRATNLGVKLLTVHASGGSAMLKAAVNAAADSSGGTCGILAVTVLTSLDDAQLAEAWGRAVTMSARAEVLRLAEMAANAGARGVVCSGLEVSEVRGRFDDSLETLVPGVRMTDDASHDQARVVTPAAAAELGATYIVLGRTVTASSDPAATMLRVATDLAETVSKAR